MFHMFLHVFAKYTAVIVSIRLTETSSVSNETAKFDEVSWPVSYVGVLVCDFGNFRWNVDLLNFALL